MSKRRSLLQYESSVHGVFLLILDILIPEISVVVVLGSIVWMVTSVFEDGRCFMPQHPTTHTVEACQPKMLKSILYSVDGTLAGSY